jgi:hypothetical protein
MTKLNNENLRPFLAVIVNSFDILMFYCFCHFNNANILIVLFTVRDLPQGALKVVKVFIATKHKLQPISLDSELIIYATSCKTKKKQMRTRRRGCN